MFTFALLYLSILYVMNIVIVITWLSSIFGLWFSLRHEGVLHRMIATLFIYMYVLFFGHYILDTYYPYLMADNFIVYPIMLVFILLILLTVVYGFINEKLSLLRKTGIISFGFLFPLVCVFILFDSQYINFLLFLLTIPFIIYIYGVVKDKNGLTREFGFMVSWIMFVLNTLYNFLIS
jgi:hypothetical protein